VDQAVTAAIECLKDEIWRLGKAMTDVPEVKIVAGKVHCLEGEAREVKAEVNLLGEASPGMEDDEQAREVVAQDAGVVESADASLVIDPAMGGALRCLKYEVRRLKEQLHDVRADVETLRRHMDD
jgi:hypothetical protein